MLKKAREIFDREGYAYKKGKSRSVLLNPEEGSRKKRSYVSNEIRAERMKTIEAKINSVMETIDLLGKMYFVG